MRLRTSLIVTGLVASLVSFGFAFSKASAAPGPEIEAVIHQSPDAQADNSTCLACHTREGFSVELDSGETLPLTIRSDAYDKSTHGSNGVTCVTCHTDITGFPHPERTTETLRDVKLKYYTSCQQCHSEQFNMTLDSVHQKSLAAGNKNAAVCADCHNPHTQQRLTNKDTGKLLDYARLHIPETCAQCHSVIYDTYKESVHGKALTQDGNLDVPTCIDCHGVHNIQSPNTATFRNSTPFLCANCHTNNALMHKYGLSTQVLNTYVADFHGTTVVLFDKTYPDQPTNKPVCTDCHGVHDIVRADDPKKGLSVRQNLLARCQTCHPDATSNFPDAWMSHYIPSTEKYPIVYYVNLFYKFFIPAVLGPMLILVVMDFGRMMINRYKKPKPVVVMEPVAEAEIEVAAETKSLVESELLAEPETLEKPEVLEEPVPVEEPKQPDQPEEEDAESATAESEPLDEPKSSDEEGPPMVNAPQPSETKTYTRFDILQRIQHIVFLISFTLLGFTGLPQKFPLSPISVGYFNLIGGIEVSRLIHHTSAIVMMIISVVHVLDLLYRVQVLRTPISMIPWIDDAQHVLHDVQYYLGFKKHKAYYGRYSYAEKMEYLALIWGTIVMGLTGFMMWNPISTLRILPGEAVPAAKAAHGGEAVLAVLAIIIWHFYHVHIKHLNKSMFTGKLSREEMEHEHPGELAMIESGKHADPIPSAVLKKRQTIYIPIAIAILAIFGYGFYFFVGYETTAVLNPPIGETVDVFVRQTPTPSPTVTPTLTFTPTLPPTETPLPTETTIGSASEGPISTPDPAESSAPTWDGQIGVLFTQKCLICHGAGASGGLILSTYADAMKGGATGSILVAGDAANSLIITKFESGKHPYAQLTPEELALIIDWINAGALEK